MLDHLLIFAFKIFSEDNTILNEKKSNIPNLTKWLNVL